MVIEDRILDFLEKYNEEFATPPKLLILPFKDYLELQDYAETLNNDSMDFSIDFSYGKMYLGMIVTFDYDATIMTIKAESPIYAMRDKVVE